jgi:glutamate synthase (NADPH/NADH) small chain
MPAVCGRVCSSKAKCELQCSRAKDGEPVAISALERFVADYHNFNEKKCEEADEETLSNGYKVAVIGAGPAGLACAAQLSAKGYKVTVFEESATVGGSLEYKVPRFRLPKAILRQEIERLIKRGFEIVTNSSVGHFDETERLISEDGYDAVYISECTELPVKLNINGENLKGVISTDSFITWLNTKEVNKFYVEAPYAKGTKTVVFGSGVEALDAARCMRRFGTDVTVICPDPESEMDASPEEILRAKEEDINFLFLTNIVEFSGNIAGHVERVFCEQLMMTTFPGSNRTKLISLYDSEFEMPADVVIVSNDTVKGKGKIADYDSGIFCFKGDSSSISAMGIGKYDADLIDSFVKNRVRL